MIDFESPQDEANFWSRSYARTLSEIEKHKEIVNRLEKSLVYFKRNLTDIEAEEKIKPEFNAETYFAQQTANKTYLGIFKAHSYVRYLHRKSLWKKHTKNPFLKHHFWWLFHNCLAHIMIGIVPCKFSFKIHDWSSKRLNMPWVADSLKSTKDAPSDTDIEKAASEIDGVLEL